MWLTVCVLMAYLGVELDHKRWDWLGWLPLLEASCWLAFAVWVAIELALGGAPN